MFLYRNRKELNECVGGVAVLVNVEESESESNRQWLKVRKVCGYVRVGRKNPKISER